MPCSNPTQTPMLDCCGEKHTCDGGGGSLTIPPELVIVEDLSQIVCTNTVGPCGRIGNSVEAERLGEVKLVLVAPPLDDPCQYEFESQTRTGICFEGGVGSPSSRRSLYTSTSLQSLFSAAVFDWRLVFLCDGPGGSLPVVYWRGYLRGSKSPIGTYERDVSLGGLWSSVATLDIVEFNPAP